MSTDNSYEYRTKLQRTREFMFVADRIARLTDNNKLAGNLRTLSSIMRLFSASFFAYATLGDSYADETERCYRQASSLLTTFVENVGIDLDARNRRVLAEQPELIAYGLVHAAEVISSEDYVVEGCDKFWKVTSEGRK